MSTMCALYRELVASNTDHVVVGLLDKSAHWYNTLDLSDCLSVLMNVVDRRGESGAAKQLQTDDGECDELHDD